MSGLRQIVRAAKESENLVVTPRLTAWLVQHGDEELDAKVAQRVYDLLTTKPRNRVASFSSSSAGNCIRRQVFEYVGAAGGAVPTPTLQNIFSDGKWRHLRWQAMLLMAGILTTVEYPLSWPAKRSKGSVDGHGFVPDTHPRYGGREFGFELKGANPYVWQTVDKTGAPPDKTLNQVHRYFLLSGFDLFVVVYENKACVPEIARCLTKRGWTYHDELRDDDEILTYSLERDQMEWEPYQGKAVYERDAEPLWRVGNKHQEFFATKEHTWPVRDHTGRMSFRRTDQLNSNSWIPFHAPYKAEEETVGLDWAEWLGWFAADGTITSTQWPSYVIRVKRDRKKDALDRLPLLVRSDLKDGYSDYRVTRGVNLDRARLILPSKDVLPGLITKMSVSELEAFMFGAMSGDGSWASTGLGVQFTQNDGPVKEAVQIAYTLLGHRMNINEGQLSAYPGTRRWMRTYTPIAVPRYERVWCPKTTNGYWLMEQDGKAILTGNTNQWLEFVVEEDPVRLQEQRIELDELNAAADHKTLPPRLASCQQKFGDTFNQCPFGGDHGTCWKFAGSYTYWP